MGLAASQMELLVITAQIHNIEFEALRLQEKKLNLATSKTRAAKKYNEALDEQRLTYRTTDGSVVSATFNNLCGLKSIDNNMAASKNKRYVFRTGGDDMLIVPQEVYNAYKGYVDDNSVADPYEFAMYMMGVDTQNISAFNFSNSEPTTSYEKALDEYIDNRCKNETGTPAFSFKETKENITNLVKNIYNASLVNKKDSGGNAAPENIEDFVKQIIADGNVDGFVKNLFAGQDIPSSISGDIQKLNTQVTKMRYEVFRQGAPELYSEATGESTDEFNYYVYWGKLIQQESGLRGCVSSDDYGIQNFENDPDALNNMILYGQITIDAVEVDNKTGAVTDEATSVYSDSTLSLSYKSEVDNRSVKKAEAEYQKALNEINAEETKYDMELQQIETTRKALTTEYDGIKQIIDDNIKRTFKIFS